MKTNQTRRTVTRQRVARVRARIAPDLTPDQLRDVLIQQTPGDWTIATYDGWSDTGDAHDVHSAAGDMTEHTRCLVLTRAHTRVVLNLTPAAERTSFHDQPYMGCHIEGHTLVEGASFTRRGIDVESCALVGQQKGYGHQYTDLRDLLDGESARCDHALAKRQTAEPVPGLPFTRQPEWFAASAATLRAGKVVQLLPHGMGTGYVLRMGQSAAAAAYRGRRPSDERATPALEQRLGVSPIFVSRFDYD